MSRFHLSRLCEACYRWKMMMRFLSSYIGLRLTRYRNINQGENTNNERHDENERKGRNCEIQQNSKRWFSYVRSKSTWWAVLIGFLQFLLGWSEGHPLRRSLARGPPPIRGTCQRYRHADGFVFGLGWVGRRLATDIKKGAVSPLC